MTTRDQRVDEQIRLALEAVPHAPVRWDRITRKIKRRRWMGLILLAMVGLVLTVVVATGFLAGKSALDPTYSPPLVDSSHLSVKFNEPASGHDLMPLSYYRTTGDSSETTARTRDPGSLGYIFKVSVEGVEGKNDLLSASWRIRHRGDPHGLPLTMVEGSYGANTHGKKASKYFSVWIEQPTHSGQYVVDFSLRSPEGVIADMSSSPVHVITDDLLKPYSAPSYTAGVPRGWRLESDYAAEPGHRFVTKLKGPDKMSVLIDTTLGVNGDPADSAIALEGLLANGEEHYKRIGVARRFLGGPAFEWSYEVGDHVSTDIFFYRGGDGFAVLAESPSNHFHEARLVARVVARSVKGRT